MKFKIISVFLSLFLLTPAYAAKEAGWDYFPENVQIDLKPTGTEWKIAHDQEVKGQFITELVPVGQSVKKWKELVSITYISYELLSKENSLRAHMESNLLNTEQVCKSKNGTFTTKVLSESATSILYRFEIKDCGRGIAADETSIVKTFKGQYGFHTVKFSSKAPLDTPGRQKQMRTVVEKAHLTITK